MEARCPKMTERENEVCGMYRENRVELRFPIMNLINERKVSGMHKKSRMEIGCVIMAVENENKVFGMHKRVVWRLQ